MSSKTPTADKVRQISTCRWVSHTAYIVASRARRTDQNRAS